MSDSDEDNSSQGSRQDSVSRSSSENLKKEDTDQSQLAKQQMVQDDILLLRDIVSYAQNVNNRITRNSFSMNISTEKSVNSKVKSTKRSKKVSVDESSRLEKALHVLMNSDIEVDAESNDSRTNEER